MALAQQQEPPAAGRGVVRQRGEDEFEPSVFRLAGGSLSSEQLVSTVEDSQVWITQGHRARKKVANHAAGTE